MYGTNLLVSSEKQRHRELSILTGRIILCSIRPCLFVLVSLSLIDDGLRFVLLVLRFVECSVADVRVACSVTGFSRHG